MTNINSIPKDSKSPVNTDDSFTIPENLTVTDVGHLPIVSTFCRRIGLAETVNSLVPTEMEIDVGTVVMAMVVDTLSGRTPLYRLPEFFKHLDTEVLLRKGVTSEMLNDSNVGRAMDKLYKVGTSKIFSQVALKAARLYNVKSQYAHYDTTSVNVWGDGYDSTDEEAINITYGHSKDHRPDLKQFLIESLCVERNIPIMGGCADGNASDKTLNNNLLTGLTKRMAEHGLEPGAFVYVADSAMVTESNLSQMGDNIFITRIPFNYRAANRAVAETVERDCWTDIGAIAVSKPTPKRPVAEYRYCETTVNLYNINYRAVVIHSSAHDKRRHKRIDRELADERQRLEASIKETYKENFFCEADAKAACDKLINSNANYHRIVANIVERPQYARGRPANNTKRNVKRMRYGIEANIMNNIAAIERKRAEAGCFVMLTNVPSDGEMGHTGEEILRVYKEQHGVERNFAFLKDPVIVNDLFLKSPERIEVLGMVLLISLLISNLIERALRRYVDDGRRTLPGWRRRQTTRPTTFMLTTKFMGLQVLRVGSHIQLGRPLTKTQQLYLCALSITPGEILNPPNPPPD